MVERDIRPAIGGAAIALLGAILLSFSVNSTAAGPRRRQRTTDPRRRRLPLRSRLEPHQHPIQRPPSQHPHTHHNNFPVDDQHLDDHQHLHHNKLHYVDKQFNKFFNTHYIKYINEYVDVKRS